MLNQVENPMVNDAHWWKRPPEIVCPHCGSEWRVPEDTPGRDGVLSRSGQYCIECIEDTRGTVEALLGWYKDSVDRGDLMSYYFRDRYGITFPTDDTDCAYLLELMRDHDQDAFIDLLADYSKSDKLRRNSGWIEYLKENN